MPNLTSKFGWNLPLVNNATDQDLWGGYLNSNITDLDGKLARTVEAKTSNFSVVVADFNKLFNIDASGGAVTATLPAASSVFSGFTVSFKASNASNTITIDGSGSETIDGATTITLDAQYDTAVLSCDGSNWQVISNKSSLSLTAASQSEVENFTNVDKYVKPNLLAFIPGLVAAAGSFDGSSSSPSTSTSFGVSSVSRTGTGIFVVNWSSSFSTANYPVTVTAQDTGAASGTVTIARISAQSASSITCEFINFGGNFDNPIRFNVIAIGV